MTFFVDVNLSPKIAVGLRRLGHEVVLPADLPGGLQSRDDEILGLLEPGTVIITKDRDFFESHIRRGVPAHLLYVRLGNMSRVEVRASLETAFPTVVELLASHGCVELFPNEIYLHTPLKG